MLNSRRFPHLVASPLFQDLPAGVAKRVLDSSTLLTAEDASPVLRQGESSPGLILIAEGALEVTYVSPEGVEVVVHLASRGETVGEMEALSDEPCAGTCRSMGSSLLLLYPRTALLDLLRHVAFTRNILRMATQRMARDNHFKTVDKFYPVEQRLCAYLSRLSRENRVIRRSQSYLARVVGCSRQTVNRQLAMLRDRGILQLERQAIVILDRDELQACLSADFQVGH